jgi:hypothetical protein
MTDLERVVFGIVAEVLEISPQDVTKATVVSDDLAELAVSLVENRLGIDLERLDGEVLVCLTAGEIVSAAAEACDQDADDDQIDRLMFDDDQDAE